MAPEREKIIRDTWRVYGRQWPQGARWFNAPAVVPVSLTPLGSELVSFDLDYCEFRIEQGHLDNVRCERVTCEGIVLEERPVK